MNTQERLLTHGETNLMADGCLGVPEAERFSGMKRSWLYEQMQLGNLPYTTCGRRRLIPRRALERLLAQNLVNA